MKFIIGLIFILTAVSCVNSQSIEIINEHQISSKYGNISIIFPNEKDQTSKPFITINNSNPLYYFENLDNSIAFTSNDLSESNLVKTKIQSSLKNPSSSNTEKSQYFKIGSNLIKEAFFFYDLISGNERPYLKLKKFLNKDSKIFLEYYFMVKAGFPFLGDGVINLEYEIKNENFILVDSKIDISQKVEIINGVPQYVPNQKNPKKINLPFDKINNLFSDSFGIKTIFWN